MTKVIVYQFRRHDPGTGRVVISACKMTAEAIARIGAEIIPDTAEEIREAGLDEEGRYYPNG
jgi:hypothetical protein